MTTESPRSVQALVDEQVERWEQQKRAREKGDDRWPLVTISREFAAQGARVGRQVAERLGFSFWDRELVHAIAEHTGAKETLLESLDEHARSGFEDFLAQTLIGVHATENEYVRQVARIVHTVDNHGGGVVVGRGAQYLLGTDRALRVRVIAPLETRIAGYAARENMTEKDAAKHIAAIEKDRQKFVRQHFDRDVTDPCEYDVIVNTARLSVEAAAAVIADAYGARFGRSPR